MSVFENIFGKKPEPVQLTGFQEYLRRHKKFNWAFEYVDNHNEVLEAVFELSLTTDTKFENEYTVGEFKQLIGKLYAEYQHVLPEVRPEDVALINVLHELPALVEIRRIVPKTSGNHWAVRYAHRPTYYGVTLIDALYRLYKLNPDLQKKEAKN